MNVRISLAIASSVVHLLPVDRHRKPPQAIHRNGALLADLQADAQSALHLETFVFRPKSVKSGFEILVCHQTIHDSILDHLEGIPAF
jgi:hypothetical protein